MTEQLSEIPGQSHGVAFNAYDNQYKEITHRKTLTKVLSNVPESFGTMNGLESSVLNISVCSLLMPFLIIAV